MTGTAVVLHIKTLSGYDSLNNPVYADSTETVQNVLIGQPSTEEVTDSIQLYGKHIEFMLGIPKGDSHNWEDTEVEFFGQKFRTFGAMIQGIEANIPTPWHHKVRVERYA